ncbi:glycerophosphodiester phosphodiesterase GDPDL4-like isoform X2 [Magnolia sinica]|uniref:glycerophosphodiester phosphodiesterase GDPDL4-like isoform X2 n=1 Tax=Magnolia sinica TaxID=86752 RepID=UPI0026592FD9|nr:glycerophosphodiester phosphodiesterase GDPDL4-like isoform X2 [Magnolia sinica]
MPIFRFLLFLSLLHSSLVSCQRSSNSSWLTLKGGAPVVIAKGGFSGVFPDSSPNAYQFASITTPNAIFWCDVQLTKDGIGICAPDIKLDNCTDISSVYNDKKTYSVNGVPVDGWFSVDYDLKDLQQNVFLIQGIYSRSPRFDTGPNTICTVEEVIAQVQPRRPAYWLNIQHDMFFSQFNLSMRSYVISVSKSIVVNYISSPEVGFLRSIVARFKGSPTKFVFRFLGADITEPSTNQTYGSLLKNLTFIKTFASGILVPKNYIWPLDNGYLLPHTSVVLDAHREGLEVFASGFANDGPFGYNFSYDPLAESLAFIDNGDFSVDGILSDFPITPSGAIGGKPVIISHNGASGFYPGSTDLAYQKAVADGADYIDCSVQMTNDGVLVCLNDINLVDGTNVVQSPFNSRIVKFPEISGASGIFTFNLTWEEIQTLKPAISNPFLDYNLQRNPAYADAGKFMTFSDFLAFARKQQVAGILISIEHAAFLVEQGLPVIDEVLKALSNASYDNQTAPDVMIRSTDSSVLENIKQQSKYKCVYKVDESIQDALNSSIEEIKRFADHVSIDRDSVFPLNLNFLTIATNIIPKLKAFNLTVHVYLFRNEFVSQAWDYFSDATVEINSFFQSAGLDGIITDFPETASRYRRTPCLEMGNNAPTYMSIIPPGGLLTAMTRQSLPPTQAPLPVLTDSDINEPPLPSISRKVPTSGGGSSTLSPTSSPPPSGQSRPCACVIMSMAMLLASLLLI